MSDLFAFAKSPLEPRQNAGEPRKNRRGSSGDPIVEPRNPGGRESRGQNPGDPRLPGNGSGSTIGPRELGQRTPDLLGERRRLEIEIEAVEQEAANLRAEQAPYERAFYAADRYLRAVVVDEESDKATRAAAYDQRWMAGHEWYPYREPYLEAERFLKALRKELVAVNKEIGH